MIFIVLKTLCIRRHPPLPGISARSSECRLSKCMVGSWWAKTVKVLLLVRKSSWEHRKVSGIAKPCPSGIVLAGRRV